MSELPLPGLRATEPIGFLAAVGLLRVCTARGTFGLAKLGWSDDAGWPGVLTTEKECDPDRLVGELLAHMRDRAAAPVFSGRSPDGVLIGDTQWKDIKVEPNLYRDWLVATRRLSTLDQREAADFLSALGSELITARSSGELKPCAFHMTSARQQFLEACRKLASSLDPSVPQSRRVKPADSAFREALFGPWEYSDEFSSLGFDPNTEAIYALVATAPGDEKPISTRAAVWLTIEALRRFLHSQWDDNSGREGFMSLTTRPLRSGGLFGTEVLALGRCEPCWECEHLTSRTVSLASNFGVSELER